MDAALASAALALGPMAARSRSSRVPLQRSLNAIRTHLGMEVAFISEFADGRRYFRQVDARDGNNIVQIGNSDPAEESYCLRVVDGRLPELMTDARQNAEASTLPATHALPVGAHLSVPIRLSDGKVYGTFCCFSHTADDSLTNRDLAMMRVFAELVAEQIEEDLSAREERWTIEQRIDAALSSGSLNMVFQPIVEVAQNRIAGFESLARFSASPIRAPDVWFAEAAHVGRAVELESIAVRTALKALPHLPPSIYVTVNLSPETIIKGDFAALLNEAPLDRIVVEVTEHQAVEKYDDLVAVIRPLQNRGLRIAIDDAGAGYASFRHILNLHPHIVKLDTSITRCIDTDRSRRALAAALRGFASETECSIVAEGVETAAELATIKTLGIEKAQGYFLGRPDTLDQATALLAKVQAGSAANH